MASQAEELSRMEQQEDYQDYDEEDGEEEEVDPILRSRNNSDEILQGIDNQAGQTLAA